MKNMKEQTNKALYLKELETTSTRRNDQKMIDYCIKEASIIVNLPSGWLYAIKKPQIETRFCFGYGCQSLDYEEANELAGEARKNVNNFLNENLEGLNKWIKDLEEIKETWSDEHWNRLFILEICHTWDLPECKIIDLWWLNNREALEFNTAELRKHRFRTDTRELTKEDIEALIEGFKEARELFKKRLQTYLKRFWLSKVHTWTYWADL